MPTFGTYETVAEVSRGAICSVWSARRIGAGEPNAPAFAVKVCQPDGEIAGVEQARRAVAVFQERVDAQRRLGGLPSSVWAPVHDSGEVVGGGPGAYYVTDLWARGSVERMVTSRQRPDARQLYSIVAGVLLGIRQIRDFLRRPCGNLRATNVLVGGEPGAWRVALTDPAAASELDGRADGRGDMRSLGEIVYLLVTHQEYHERFGWPIGESAEWKRLANGERWRALCNRLLDPNPSSAPTVEEIEQTLLNVGAGGSKGKGKLIAAGVAGVVVVGTVIGGAILMRPAPAPAPVPTEVAPEEWGALVDEYHRWFAEFASDVAGLDDARAASIAARAPEFAVWFKALRGGLEQDDPWEIAGVPKSVGHEELKGRTPASAAGRDAGKATAELFEMVQGVRRTIESREWSLGKEARGLGGAWRGLGWEGPAASVEAVAERVEPSAELLQRVSALIAILDKGREIEESRAAVDVMAARIAAEAEAVGGDKVLGTFSEWARRYPGRQAAGAGMEVVNSLAAGVERVRETGAALTRFLESDVRREVCFDQLANSAVYARLATTGEATPELFTDWRNEAERREYARPSKADDPRPLKDLADSGSRLAEQFEKLRKKELAAPAESVAMLEGVLRRLAAPGASVGGSESTAEKVEAVRARLAAVSGLEWDCRTKAEIVAIDYGSVLREIDDVARAWQKLNALNDLNVQEELNRLASVESPVRDSETIRAWWVAQRAEVFKEPDESDRAARAAELESELVELDKAVGRWGAPAGRERTWMREVERVAGAERDAMLAEFLAGRSAEALWSGAEAVALGQRYAAWTGELETVVAAYGEVERLLNEGYGLDESGAPGGATVREMAASVPASVKERVGGALADVESRLSALEGVATATTSAAVAPLVTLSPANRPELTLAAWRRLGEVEGGVWPSSASELEREAKEFPAALRAVPRGAVVAAEVSAERRRRWESYVERATAPEQVAGAMEEGIVRALGIEAGAIERPLVRYRMAAQELRAGVGAAGVTDEGVKGAVERFAAAVPEEMKKDGRVAGLLEELERAVSGEQVGPAPTDPTTLGPGALGGWVGEQVAGAGGETMVRFSRGGLRLDFVRVDAGSGVPEPVYLSAGEVSLGEFVQMIDLAGADGWNAVREFIPQAEDLPPEAPRGWRWVENRREGGGRMARAGEWLQAPSRLQVGEGAGKMPAYARPLLRPGSNGLEIMESMSPRDESPMQYVSPAAAVYAAALVGCRLPTVEEWRLAMEAGGGGGTPNLRDETWRVQQEYIREVREQMNRVADQFPYADAGAFIPAGVAADDRATVAPGAGDDGWLWFAPGVAGQGGGAGGDGFVHLRGNVAEVIFAGVGSAPASSDAGVVRSFVSQRAGDLRVIGGSAIGPPEIRWDEPTPVPDTSASWADVGFRLAFSGTGTKALRLSMAEQVGALLSEPSSDLFLMKK